MEKDYTEEQKYTLAKKRVEKLQGFYVHLITSILITVLLMFINFKFTPKTLWFWFPLLGMGVGLFFHWFDVFGSRLFFGKDWERKQIEKYMDDDKF